MTETYKYWRVNIIIIIIILYYAIKAAQAYKSKI